MKTVTVFFFSIFLVACGGGGGSTSTQTQTSTLPLTIVGDAFIPVGPGLGNPVHDIYTQDLNYDGIDEIIIAGLRAPDNAPTNSYYDVQVYGWNQGVLNNETSNWMPNGSNRIIGTGDVSFGDLDGDGYIDVVMSGSTDTNTYYADPVVYFNEGPYFTKMDIDPGVNVWQHDLTVFDRDGDGYIDAFAATDYGPNTMTAWFNSERTVTINLVDYSGFSASAINFTDFDGDNTVEVVLSDANGFYTNDQAQDVGIFKVDVFFLPSYIDPDVRLPKASNTVTGVDHDIRNLLVDFNDDGNVDIVSFQRPLGNTPNITLAHFFRNDSLGELWTDVTNDILVNYDSTGIDFAYQPIVTDITGDGLNDIVLADQILVKSSDGKYVGMYRDYLQTFLNDAEQVVQNSKPNAWNPVANKVHFVRGPNNNYYLATVVTYEIINSHMESVLVILNLGQMPNTTPKTATELLSSDLWF